MRFTVDECTGPKVAQWLRQNQHDVFSVYEEARGLDDDIILQMEKMEAFVGENLKLEVLSNPCDVDITIT